ncbi:S41 family peptidase [Myxococcus sp. K38C18041901]|uniref:S41 family peptidase n=1 Tax=Myxococcus guangdongensis TaxID=2906760 RepID=UPI0020A7FBFD|nr:S41 family peptidase [Myxococcus guangdongensis]MCP3058975.1 S41 family peptidase [Myxococcus guangdongensis]
MPTWTVGVGVLTVLFGAGGVTGAETRGPGTRVEPALENAAVLGRVWGEVKYAHPALAMDAVDWDAALLDALPGALAASTPDALAATVGDMLRALEDPLTRVVRDESVVATSTGAGPLSRWVDDVLVLDLDRRFANVDALYPAMSALEPELARARRVVIDLRVSGGDEAAWAEMALGVLERALVAEELTAPAERFRVYSGFPVQFGPSSGGYSASVETRLARRFTPVAGTPKRTVALLVNARTPLTPRVLALMSTPRTRVVAQGGLDESSAVKTRTLPLPGGYRAVVRASELVFASGASGLFSDVTVPDGADEGDSGPAVQAALRLVRSGTVGTRTRTGTSISRRSSGTGGAPHATSATRNTNAPSTRNAQATPLAISGAQAATRSTASALPTGGADATPHAASSMRTTSAPSGAQATPRTTSGGQASRRKTASASTLPAISVDAMYETPAYPPEPHRLLAVIRFWNVMRFFHPDPKALRDWDAVLPTFLGQARAAADAREYAQVLYTLAARVHDGHIFVAEQGQPLRSLAEATAPVVLRPVQGRFIVTELPAPEVTRAAGLQVGDEVVAVEQEPVALRAQRLASLLGASHDAARTERVASLLLAGADGKSVEVMLQGSDGRIKESRLPRSRNFLPFLRPPPRDDAPWKTLKGGIGYVDLRRLRAESVDPMLTALKDTRGLVLDLRGYPQGSAWTLAPRLNTRGATTSALISRPRLSAGERLEERFPALLPPSNGPLYRGHVILLVDARTLSQGEYTAMMLRAASGARLVGSTTAGAVGDTTNVCLPGALCVLFTGQRFETPEGHAVQGAGLRPDVEVHPTLEGLRAGRDEVLERALSLLNEATAR